MNKFIILVVVSTLSGCALTPNAKYAASCGHYSPLEDQLMKEDPTYNPCGAPFKTAKELGAIQQADREQKQYVEEEAERKRKEQEMFARWKEEAKIEQIKHSELQAQNDLDEKKRVAAEANCNKKGLIAVSVTVGDENGENAVTHFECKPYNPPKQKYCWKYLNGPGSTGRQARGYNTRLGASACN